MCNCQNTRSCRLFGVSSRSLPKREAFAAERLRVWITVCRSFPASGPDEARLRAVVQFLFFVRIIEQWRAINTTLGVLCLVRVGDCPAKCPDHEIDSLKAMIDGHGYIRLPEAPAAPVGRKIAIGAKVKVTAGPFGGLSGLYAGQSTRERELVLLNVLGGQRPVSIAAGLVVPQ